MREYKECYRCGLPATDMHHIYNGALRKKSEQFGAVIPLCRKCHNYYHHDAQGRKDYNDLKAVFQLEIMGEWDMSIDEFREIFHKSYI